MLKKIDYLGCEPKLYINSDTTFSTKFGGIITILLAIIISVLFLLFGKDFYYRINPIVITEFGTYPSYPVYYLDSSNFTLAVAIEDDQSMVWKNDSEIYLQLHLVAYEFNNGDSVYNETITKLVPCEEKHFAFNTSQNSVKFKNHQCFDFSNLKAGGFWDASYVYYFYFSVNICPNGKLSPDGEPCALETSNIFNNNNHYFSIYMQQYTVNPTDYNDPMKWQIKNFYYLLDKSIQKNYRFNYIETKIKSDYGWLFETLSNINVLSIDLIEFDVSTNSNFDSRISTASFYFSKRYVYYSRSYTKIQTLAANVGGVMKLFFLMGMLLVKKYNLFYMNKELAESIVHYNRKTSHHIPNNQTIKNLNPKSMIINNFVSTNHILDPCSKASRVIDIADKHLKRGLTQMIVIDKSSILSYYKDQIFSCCIKKRKLDYKLAEDVVKNRMDTKHLILMQIELEELRKSILGDSPPL